MGTENGPGPVSSVRVRRGLFVQEDEVGLCKALKAKGLRVGGAGGEGQGSLSLSLGRSQRTPQIRQSSALDRNLWG